MKISKIRNNKKGDMPWYMGKMIRVVIALVIILAIIYAVSKAGNTQILAFFKKW